jgi:hypothetical protein
MNSKKRNKKTIFPYNGIDKNLVLKIHKYTLLIRKQKDYGQRTISKLIFKKFKKNISENTISNWIHHNKVPFNNKKTQFKPKPCPPKKELIELYNNKGLSSSKIGLKYNVSTITVIKWLERFNIKIRSHKESMNTKLIKTELAELRLKKPTNKNYRVLSKEKAYILGVLCGDGYIDKKRIKLEIRKDKEFIEKFQKCLEKVYGIRYQHKFYKKRESLILDISSMIIAKDLNKYGIFRTKNWIVPDLIKKSNNKEVISKFLCGLYDSDGYANKYSIGITCSSYNGLKDVSQLLRMLGIKNSLKNYKYPMIYIGKRDNIRLFRNNIGFTIERKMNRITEV